MSRTLRITGRARDDVDAIFDWLVRRSARGAIAWYLAFCRAARDIASNPGIYALAPEERLPRRAEGKKRRPSRDVRDPAVRDWKPAAGDAAPALCIESR